MNLVDPSTYEPKQSVNSNNGPVIIVHGTSLLEEPPVHSIHKGNTIPNLSVNT